MVIGKYYKHKAWRDIAFKVLDADGFIYTVEYVNLHSYRVDGKLIRMCINTEVFKELKDFKEVKFE